ncbi:GlsB/YeaQ/YmgE family stress response membrane protein [Jannaschia seohaensis]|uniref:Major facilitator superfamily (MFS) profile domain-containing protein n=1 Tax=Jannaschia seohaensis TaxID=475081 RepID=A0A2Y9AUI9_9RHOB|nr:GlsB/YeaQ/YmgE family stress response membrane protein [Jannaschia seohaensis]PWJ17523.1 hypothetical protein BCF38_106134 [Jannaschia seohaensis]SSA47655.1 hypothetical protein SAMN05421539_106134 [Jannaschia seohaensis]
MEAVLEGFGIAALATLALVGLAVGLLMGKLTGRSPRLYGAIGAVAAVATPFMLALLGITVLAAGGLLLVAAVGLVGAVVTLGVVRALSRRG